MGAGEAPAGPGDLAGWGDPWGPSAGEHLYPAPTSPINIQMTHMNMETCLSVSQHQRAVYLSTSDDLCGDICMQIM